MDLTIDDVLGIEHREVRNLEHFRGRRFKGVSTDSRSLRPGEVFVALKGGQFEGQMFLGDFFEVGGFV
jgi:UDP-N-acetylmuramyl pentapeptide synthase